MKHANSTLPVLTPDPAGCFKGLAEHGRPCAWPAFIRIVTTDGAVSICLSCAIGALIDSGPRGVAMTIVADECQPVPGSDWDGRR